MLAVVQLLAGLVPERAHPLPTAGTGLLLFRYVEPLDDPRQALQHPHRASALGRCRRRSLLHCIARRSCRHLDHEALIGKEAELIDVEHLALRSKPPLQKAVEIFLHGLYQLLLLAQHQMQRRNIARECGGIFHGIILSNNKLDEHTRNDHSRDSRSVGCSAKDGSRRMRVKSTPSSSNASSCSVSSIESASALGHLYFPRSKRLYQIASPVRSQTSAFTRSARAPKQERVATDRVRAERLGDDGAQAREAAAHVHRRRRHEDPLTGRQLQHRSPTSSRTSAGKAAGAISSDRDMPLARDRRTDTPDEEIGLSSIAGSGGSVVGATTTGTMRGGRAHHLGITELALPERKILPVQPLRSTIGGLGLATFTLGRQVLGPPASDVFPPPGR